MNPDFKRKLEELAKMPFGTKSDCECGYDDEDQRPIDRFKISDADRYIIKHPLEFNYFCYAGTIERYSCVMFKEGKFAGYCMYKGDGE